MIRRFLQQIDALLRRRGRFMEDAPAAKRLRWLATFVIVSGFFYGAVMGTYSGLRPERYHQMLYSGFKVPLLLLVTFILCVCSFFVLNTILGLRDDFGKALHAVLGTQACVSIVLASLAPVTAFFYVSGRDYQTAVLVNALMFGVASLAGMRFLLKAYAPLILKEPLHRRMLLFWIVMYAFVGIQMGWLLRPFVGNPTAPVEFLRPDAWGNAYVVIVDLILNELRRRFGQIGKRIVYDGTRGVARVGRRRNCRRSLARRLLRPPHIGGDGR